MKTSLYPWYKRGGPPARVGLQEPGDVPRHFLLTMEVAAMEELSIFIDESGDIGAVSLAVNKLCEHQVSCLPFHMPKKWKAAQEELGAVFRSHSLS